MDDVKKQALLREAILHIEKTAKHILGYQIKTDASIKRIRSDIIKQSDDTEYLIEWLMHELETQKQLEILYKSPYFVRCRIRFAGEKNARTIYFGRFSLMSDFIYSWVTPAASIRFESPGKFSYVLPDGTVMLGDLQRKDQFMIIKRKIFFMSTESTEYPRELIYQEYFSQKKVSFSLREIVEQMEKAQDTIIRSHYYGPLLITGAVGSGKTTLALHRAAYLIQSPETESLFKPSNVIVFVQDQSTKKYFSNLLPELGVYNVKILTFEEWAMKILEIPDVTFVRRFGSTEEEKDSYEFAKYKALKSIFSGSFGKDVKKFLLKVYDEFLSNNQKRLFKKQLEEWVLDRFDLTILIKSKLNQEKKLVEKIAQYKKGKKGKYQKKLVKQPASYSLIILDEAENFLKEQIDLIKTCIDLKTNAIIYVGDLAQQTHMWTIKAWNEIDNNIARNRQITLHKMYRNSKQILNFLQRLGYEIKVPDSIKDAKGVVEKIVSSKVEEILFVKKILSENVENTTGILAKTPEYLADYKKHFTSRKNIYIMTINEAQGVEFDRVILVGIHNNLFQNGESPQEIKLERDKVKRDLLYVAITRAMKELYIVGSVELKELLK